jgi:hypothetical protein
MQGRKSSLPMSPASGSRQGYEVNVVLSSWPFVADAPPDILIADELPVHRQQEGI